MRNAAGFRRSLLQWYARHKRDLPWRRNSDPYPVWISEIMLQQTRVNAVIPYYERFLNRFPSVEALACASEQDLLAAWAGLGYYSRARNLQAAAKLIHERGRFPNEYEQIRELPGIGDYTAAAVSSIAFGRPRAALDGNVMRVLSRLLAETGDIGSPVTRVRLQAAADELLDRKRPGEFNQAMMELGATVCLPQQPQCLLCPVTEHCEARRSGRQREFPIKRKRASPNVVAKELLVVNKRCGILFWQRPADSRRLAGFWELPEPSQLPGARVEKTIGQFRHTIVNTTYCFQVLEGSIQTVPDGFSYLTKKSLDEVPLSTTAKKALACLQNRRLMPGHG
jgi:A/G-specific adenine glycosylase